MISKLYFSLKEGQTALTHLVVFLCILSNAIGQEGPLSTSEAPESITRANLISINAGPRKAAKYTELTRAIGQISNDNLNTYEQFRKLGINSATALALLKNKRHPFCNKAAIRCDPNSPYRTIDGTCNNLNHPRWGSSYSTFRRLFLAQYSDGYNKAKGFFPQKALPNARLISSTVHPDLIHPDPTLTNMVPQIGQFLDHDFSLTVEDDRRCCTTEKGNKDCMPIDIPKNDYFYSNISKPQSCMEFTRSTAFCFPTASGVREQVNIDTSFIDASQVYGSEDERSGHIREKRGGRLQMSTTKLIVTVAEVEEKYKSKLDFMGKFLAGDDRVNEMPALTVMHTLWVREHNRIADQIAIARPNWNDEKVFQEARRIVIAEWQNVVFGQFLPTVLGPQTMTRYSLDLGPDNKYSEYNGYLDATLYHYFSTAAYRFGHTLLNGLIKLMKTVNEPNNYFGGSSINADKEKLVVKPMGSYHVRDNYFNSAQIERNGSEGYDLILAGLMIQNAQTFDRFVSEDFTNFLLKEKENDFGADLVARNIQRGRDHAIPSYNAYRKVCGLKLMLSWDLKPNEILDETWQKLRSVYQNPDDIELFPGGISEIPTENAASGPTFNCLKAMQFNLLKYGDRFFFTHKNQPRPFRPDVLEAIRRRTLGDIICDNSDVSSTTTNVFKIASLTNPLKPCRNSARTKLDLEDFIT